MCQENTLDCCLRALRSAAVAIFLVIDRAAYAEYHGYYGVINYRLSSSHPTVLNKHKANLLSTLIFVFALTLIY